MSTTFFCPISKTIRRVQRCYFSQLQKKEVSNVKHPTNQDGNDWPNHLDRQNVDISLPFAQIICVANNNSESDDVYVSVVVVEKKKKSSKDHHPCVCCVDGVYVVVSFCLKFSIQKRYVRKFAPKISRKKVAFQKKCWPKKLNIYLVRETFHENVCACASSCMDGK